MFSSPKDFISLSQKNSKNNSASPKKVFTYNAPSFNFMENAALEREKSQNSVLKAVNASLEKYIQEKDEKLFTYQEIIEKQSEEIHEKEALIAALYRKEVVANEEIIKNDITRDYQEKVNLLEGKINMLLNKNDQVCKLNSKLILEVENFADEKSLIEQKHSANILKIKQFWAEKVF